MSRSFISAAFFCLLFSSYAFAQSVSSLNNKGLKLYKEGKFDAAIDAFTKAIEISSSLVVQKEIPQGNALAARGPIEPAGEEVSVVDPRTAGALVNRGNVYFVLGDMDRALSDYDRAIRIKPGLVEAHVCRASVWLFKNDPDHAIEDYSRAIKIDPKFVKAYVGRAMALTEKGDQKAAFSDLEVAAGLEPSNPEVYHRRAEAKQAGGDIEGALADYERSMKLDGRYAGPYFGRGKLLYSKGDLKAAVSELTKAIERDQRIPHAFMLRGFAFLAMRKDAEADADFKRALSIMPQLKSEIDDGIKLIKSQLK